MEFQLPTTAADPAASSDTDPEESSNFRLSSQPVVDHGNGERGATPFDLPRSYGIQTLCLMARDPHTLFAYWDIDWSSAFRDQPPKQRIVHLRVLDPEGAELASIEVEPMAGNCYLSVPDADVAYHGEIGYYHPAKVWNQLATSEIVTTPADTMAGGEEVDFATVPFHLSFQHMIDLLRISKQENESLTTMLAELRERVASKDPASQPSDGERELARIVEEAAASRPAGSASTETSDYWTQQRIERIFGLGGSSPSEGFAGPSPLGGFGGSSRTR